MAMLQTEWASQPQPGAVGRRANMEEWNTITRIAEEGGIGFAHPVQRGSGDDHAAPFTDGNFLGIVEADQSAVDGPVGSPLEYAEGANIPVCEVGVLWARADGDCTAGGLVYWTGDGYADAGDTLIPGAEFDSTATDGSLVKVRLRRTPAIPTPAGGGD